MKSTISRFVSGSIASLFLSLAMAMQPLSAAALDASPAPDASQSQDSALHTNALAIEQELGKRVALMEQQESKARSESNRLQIDLGRWMDQEASISTKMNEVEADIRSRESVVSDAQAQREKIEGQRQSIEREIEKKRKESITCYIPVAQLYCLFADLGGKLASLDSQLVDATRRWMQVNNEYVLARSRLHRLQQDQKVLASNQVRTKRAIDELGNRLIALQAALGTYRKTSQAHHEALGSFTAQLDEFNALPPSQRPDVIERRLARLRDQLVAEIGQACQLMKSAGPALPESAQHACAKN